MEISSIINAAFEAGGMSLVLFTILVSGAIYVFKKMMSRISDMDSKIDTMKDEITEIKLQNEKYITAIKFCDKPDCKLKTLIEK